MNQPPRDQVHFALPAEQVDQKTGELGAELRDHGAVAGCDANGRCSQSNRGSTTGFAGEPASVHQAPRAKFASRDGTPSAVQARAVGIQSPCFDATGARLHHAPNDAMTEIWNIKEVAELLLVAANTFGSPAQREERPGFKVREQRRIGRAALDKRITGRPRMMLRRE